MFDSTGSYNSGFILMGAMIALSGIILYPIPCIKSSIKSKVNEHKDRTRGIIG